MEHKFGPIQDLKGFCLAFHSLCKLLAGHQWNSPWLAPSPTGINQINSSYGVKHKSQFYVL